MQVVPIDVPHLGNRSHLVHDGEVAIVVDPPRDVAVVEALAASEGVHIVAVADTHVHNDYLSGALALARRHRADHLLSAAEPVDFPRRGVRHGDVVDVGRLRVRVIDTPGHTPHHQSFLVGDESGPAALLSGGSLLHGTVGRTDLVDPALTVPLARAQWDSARLQGDLDARTGLHPTHGFGSFCAAAVADCVPRGTIADERGSNPALVLEREEFVRSLVAGFGPVPGHYRHMAPLNRSGAGADPVRAPRPVTSEEVTDAVLAGSWVVDLRDRSSFAAGHVSGAVSVEYGGQFAVYVGWLVPWQDDIVLLTDSPVDLEPALRDLAAIGIDGVGTHVLGAGDQLTATYRRSDWAGFRASSTPRVVVDVRQRDEYDAGHLPGAVHLPVQDVESRGAALPAGELWVHCRSGYRAGIAASLLHRMGRHVVHVDDDWARVAELAIPVTPGLAA